MVPALYSARRTSEHGAAAAAAAVTAGRRHWPKRPVDDKNRIGTSKATRISEPTISYAYLDCAIGQLLVAGNGEVLRRVAFPSRNGAPAVPEPGWRQDSAPLAEAMRQIGEYFAGGRLEFSLPVRFEGGPLEKAVWNAMREIPYGQTVSYGEIAAGLGDPSVARAVGAACGKNPLPIVIPCHRVVGADGSLTGFGGGLPTKRFLLDLEQRACPQPGLQYSLFG